MLGVFKVSWPLNLELEARCMDYIKPMTCNTICTVSITISSGNFSWKFVFVLA
uniref:Uncharacterized protein n=1 Tax=Rhizophora mucronata TaxID=61149 RepID=A0A2P2QHH6_RHIMU